METNVQEMCGVTGIGDIARNGFRRSETASTTGAANTGRNGEDGKIESNFEIPVLAIRYGSISDTTNSLLTLVHNATASQFD